MKNKVRVRLTKALMNKYEALWDAFGSNSFTLDDATRVLTEKARINKEGVPVFLAELRNAGRLMVQQNQQDLRKSIYTLKSGQDVISEALKTEGAALGRGEVEGILKKAADLIRTRVDYRFILVLLFMKRISDLWEMEYHFTIEEAKSDGLSEVQAVKEALKPAHHDFDIPEKYLWKNIRNDVQNMPENFAKALKEISERNPDLKDAFDVDFIQFAGNRENAEILRQLVEVFSEKRLYNVSPDILGDAYEWILRYFAPDKAKEGEVYTPREVISLIVEMLDPKPSEHVYDPASASNGMLITSHNYVKKKYGSEEAEKLFLHGQEVNTKTQALGRMNLYIHDIKNAYLASGDTLLYPKFKTYEDVVKYDLVIANPPWNQDGYDEERLKKGEFWQKRFPFGFVSNQSADWAWIQHMLASAKPDTGRVGVVIDNGCLFRGGKERLVRSKVINQDLLECVILLPEKLFYNTGAPGAIMIFRKHKPGRNKGKILFINASTEFEQHPDVRKLNILSDKNIKRIVKAYKEFSDETGFSEAISMEKIKENDYNLNVTLYVFPQEEEEHIDIDKEWQELKALEKDSAEIEKKIEGYLKEISGNG